MDNPFTRDDAKKIAVGAAIGAVVALPLPFIGPPLGALIGGGFVAMRKLGQKRGT